MYILLNNLKYSSVKQMLLHITKYIPVLYCIIITAGRFLDVNLGGMKLEVRCILQKLQNKIGHYFINISVNERKREK